MGGRLQAIARHYALVQELRRIRRLIEAEGDIDAYDDLIYELEPYLELAARVDDLDSLEEEDIDA